MNTNHLFDYYNGSYHSKRNESLLNDDFYFWARSKASAQLYFSEVPKFSKIFEFGVGIGQNIASLQNASGYDISTEALEACQRRNLIVYNKLDVVPDEEFDIVLSRHTLEHVPDPLESLLQMREKLKKGGRLILVLPKEKHGKATFEPDLNNHLYSWNFRSINNLLVVAGFKPILNKLKYSIGYKQLLPLYKLFGYNFYYMMVMVVGWLTRENGELIIHALREE